MSFEIRPAALGPTGHSLYKKWPARISGGLVVRFSPGGSESWIGNFLGGSTSCRTVLQHPNGNDIIVVADGEAHIIGPQSRELRDRFGDDIEEVTAVPALRSVLFRRLTHFETIAADNSRWCSQRISWDGFRNIEMRGTKIAGEAWTPVDEAWMPFTLDLVTRRVESGLAGPQGLASDAPRSLTRNVADKTELFPRHCEEPLRRSNPVGPVRSAGLLRCARNDAFKHLYFTCYFVGQAPQAP